jgi:hypothetical protein
MTPVDQIPDRATILADVGLDPNRRARSAAPVEGEQPKSRLRIFASYAQWSVLILCAGYFVGQLIRAALMPR